MFIANDLLSPVEITVKPEPELSEILADCYSFLREVFLTL